MKKNQNGRRYYDAEDHVIITALLMLKTRWSQTLLTQALDIVKSIVSKIKSKAIRLGLMDKKRMPTAEGLEYLEWADTQYDIFGHVKKINRFSSEML